MVKRKRAQKQGGIALFLLISFLLGSLLSFVHEDALKVLFLSQAPSRRAILNRCFALSCIVAPSVNGCLFIPLLTFICGTALASEIKAICMAMTYPTGESLISFLLLLLLLPLYFLVSGWGMNKSIELADTKDKFLSLTIMFIGLGLLLFGQNIMPI